MIRFLFAREYIVSDTTRLGIPNARKFPNMFRPSGFGITVTSSLGFLYEIEPRANPPFVFAFASERDHPPHNRERAIFHLSEIRLVRGQRISERLARLLYFARLPLTNRNGVATRSRRSLYSFIFSSPR